MTRISVCMSVFNGELFIEEQLRSIVGQLHEDDELIVVSDLSTDNSLRILKSINMSAKLVIVENAKNIGPCKSFERAIKMAKGKFIFLSDQDDVWLENRVTSYMHAFSGGADVVIGNAKLIDDKGKTIVEDYLHNYPLKIDLASNILKPNYVGATMAFRRDILPFILPFPRLVYMHDMWIGIYCILTKRVIVLDEILMHYRRHQNVFTKLKNPIKDKIIWRLRYVLCALIMCVRLIRLKL